MLKARSHSPLRTGGFTLIEMLVATTIMMIILGGGIAAYINFNDKQKVTQSVRDVQQLFRSAQVKARVGQTPQGCGKLSSYRVAGANGGSTVTLSAVCTDPPNIITITTQDLQSGVTLGNAIAVDYQTLQGGVTGSGSMTVRSGNTYTYQFTVDSGGAVSVGAFTE